jgi:ABC-type glutathione transport system ATPase component
MLMEINNNKHIKEMKKDLRINYLTPRTQVVFLDPRTSLMVTSSVGNANSESFQNENDFQSIW